MQQPSLEQLEQQQLIWRGRESSGPVAARPSGWPELDRQLGGGLPSRGVITVQGPTGIGELRLLWPFLSGRGALSGHGVLSDHSVLSGHGALSGHSEHSEKDRLVALIAPPYPLNAESLPGAGMDLKRLLLVQPGTDREALWAAEQCLKSGACQAVCLWQDRVPLVQARRLQLAARAGESANFLFLGAHNAAAGLPVDLCLELSPHPHGIAVSVPRRKQGWALSRFVVAMTDVWPELTLDTRPRQRAPYSGFYPASEPRANTDTGARIEVGGEVRGEAG
ncbi:hypothetical protein [Marinimicrobium sp. C2-29]|uniref:hypothetical protein n=1 Tax=Marinimicrobium sp. C2-29 TaxID=3139825 RepID=UPI003139B626